MTSSQIDTELVALMDLIKGDQFSNTEVRRTLHNFQCPGDSDVEAYLQRYAYTNENLGTSRTYLALDYAKYDQEHHLPPVVAYFTLAGQSTQLLLQRDERSGLNPESRALERAVLSELPATPPPDGPRPRGG